MAVRSVTTTVAAIVAAVILVSYTNAYAAADVVMSVGQTKWVELGRFADASTVRSSDSSIVSIEGKRQLGGGLEVLLKCKKAGTAVISWKTTKNESEQLTVQCSPMVIPETPIGLISLLGSSLGALYIFSRIRRSYDNR